MRSTERTAPSGPLPTASPSRFCSAMPNHYAVIQTAGFSLPFTPAFLPALNNATNKRVRIYQEQRTAHQGGTRATITLSARRFGQQAKTGRNRPSSRRYKTKAGCIEAQPIVIKITAHPTSLNADALAKPFATILSIQCAAGSRKISNFNFGQRFCYLGNRGNVSVELKIKIGDLTLSKKYPGVAGLTRSCRISAIAPQSSMPTNSRR